MPNTNTVTPEAEVQEESAINPITRSDVSWVDPRMVIIRDGFNTRKLLGDIDGLAASINVRGVRRPLEGFKEKQENGETKVIVIDGERRMTAVKQLLAEGLSPDAIKVPFLLRKKPSMEEQLLSMIVSNDGKRMTILEEGHAFLRLVGYKWTNVRIAEQLGKSTAYVSNALLLAKAPMSIQLDIESGKISATEATNVLRKSDDSDSAAKTITDAIETAEKEGSEKATSKHTKTKPTSQIFVFVDADGETHVYSNSNKFTVTLANGVGDIPEGFVPMTLNPLPDAKPDAILIPVDK